jgi:3-methylcrotonyl-CoA carboxylase alpha subunit
MFRKLLIANRGEIACRVVKTAKRLGIQTVAVYSEPDASAMHVDLADEAWSIGGGPARDSYLAIDKLLEVARRSRAEAVHPGYGFLSENPAFAEACAAAGLVFVGPPASAMRSMGSKVLAKTLMQRAGVATPPGYHGDATDLATLTAAAEHIGFPLLIKASCGGGGRGMRLVREAGELEAAIAGAAREALASFGDGRLLIEKYLMRSRHVEVQIFADAQGNCISFPERDCSMQRRRQKVLEETPAPRLSSSLRQVMHEAAIKAAKAVGYVGAGTVEFLVQDGRYFFLEMNTRLQVEHPITEMISGQDLVEWQLHVASGEALPLAQQDLVTRGCAMEVRICAEDPANDFLPSVGEIEHLRLPSETGFVRVDTGVRLGDRIEQYYDPLLAKVIAWGADRDEAVRRLKSALGGFEIVGVMTNSDFLRALCEEPGFLRAEYDSGFVESNVWRLTRTPPISEGEEILLLAAGSAKWLATLSQQAQARAMDSQDPWSPWATIDGWRLDAVGGASIAFMLNGRHLLVQIRPDGACGFRLDIGSRQAQLRFQQRGERFRLWLDGATREIGVVSRANGFVVTLAGRNYQLGPCDPLWTGAVTESLDQELRAPLPARISRVLVAEGEAVKKGDALVILEVMKTEFTLAAPRDAEVAVLHCKEGEWIAEGARLATLGEAPPA